LSASLSSLPDDRAADGTPSVTDFLLLDLPPVRDDLANNFEGTTFETDDPEVRVYIGTGILVSAFETFAAGLVAAIVKPDRL
jgi:hypothetical protein